MNKKKGIVILSLVLIVLTFGLIKVAIGSLDSANTSVLIYGEGPIDNITAIKGGNSEIMNLTIAVSTTDGSVNYSNITVSVLLPILEYPASPVTKVSNKSMALCHPKQFQEKNIAVSIPFREIYKCDIVGFESIPNGFKINDTARVSKGTIFLLKNVYTPVFSATLVNNSLNVVNNGKLISTKIRINNKFLDMPRKPPKLLLEKGACADVRGFLWLNCSMVKLLFIYILKNVLI